MLNIKARNQLRALAHSIKPVVSVGKKGHSESLVKELQGALLAHELIKVQFQKGALEESEELIAKLCTEIEAELIEFRGHVATIYKTHPEKPQIRITR